eukprot:3837561-Rhodomonas_salina.1
MMGPGSSRFNASFTRTKTTFSGGKFSSSAGSLPNTTTLHVDEGGQVSSSPTTHPPPPPGHHWNFAKASFLLSDGALSAITARDPAVLLPGEDSNEAEGPLALGAGAAQRPRRRGHGSSALTKQQPDAAARH